MTMSARSMPGLSARFCEHSSAALGTKSVGSSLPGLQLCRSG
jgi:hypothetical protein